MDTPDEFKEFCKTDKCLVKVIAFDKPNGLRVILNTDSRNGEIAKKNKNIVKNKYRFPVKENEQSQEQKDILKVIEKDMERNIFRKAISKFSKQEARKIELTPFGKIKRKHKVLKKRKK